ncbi:hypothetical protein BKA83DRAFT_676992 [Pisolithus microcarpus]|nr:hypothetical protein BKA83DRAFT_676992 [Pisolithus microcarpus]
MSPAGEGSTFFTTSSAAFTFNMLSSSLSAIPSPLSFLPYSLLRACIHSRPFVQYNPPLAFSRTSYDFMPFTRLFCLILRGGIHLQGPYS